MRERGFSGSDSVGFGAVKASMILGGLGGNGDLVYVSCFGRFG